MKADDIKALEQIPAENVKEGLIAALAERVPDTADTNTKFVFNILKKDHRTIKTMQDVVDIFNEQWGDI